MGEADNLFGDAHVRRYQETNGDVGHIWREGSTILLLTTTGRKSGEKRTAPLIYASDGARYVVQVKGDKFHAKARTAHGEERERLWKKANEVWKSYDDYAKKTAREIPVVVLERA